MRDRLKKIKILRYVYTFFRSLFTWILNYIISAIPFWCIRHFFYLLAGMKIGKGARIGIHCKVAKPSGIVLGDGAVINEFCYLDGRGGLSIGNDASISMYTKIITASHQASSSDFKYFEEGVEIEDHVWIGTSAIILNGSHLSQGSVIGAGAVFKGKSEANGIYTSNPAKLMKYRTSDLSYEIDYKPFFK